MRGQPSQWLSVVCAVLIGGCAWFGAEAQPDWVQSPHSLYPSQQYLTGLAEGDSREQAENRAYAVVARIFSAKVQSRSMDYESYAIKETDSGSRAKRTVQLDQRTHVTSNKILENVKILEVWWQPSTKHFFALAGLNRQQAEEAIIDRLRNIDESIKNFIDQGRSHSQKIQRIRSYKQAMARLADREFLNADLQVIRSSGKSQPAPYRLSDLQREFQNFVAKELVISIAMTGEHQEELERAVVEGLEREGLMGVTVSSQDVDSHKTVDVAIVGQGKLWTIDLPDPLFKYVRWCGDIDIYEHPSQRLIGVISETGREGHVTEQEAKVRAHGRMQQVLSQKVAHLLTQSVFDMKNNNPVLPQKRKACPQ